MRRDDFGLDALGLGRLATGSPTLAREGARTDAVVRLDFRPLKSGQDASKAEAPVATASAPPAPGSLLPTTPSGAAGVPNVTQDPTAVAGVAASTLPGLEYRPWNLYAFGQQTLERSGGRLSNDRVGVGGGWQASSRLRLGGKVSDGDGGLGGQLYADYAIDDRSTLYLTYARETEVPDQSYAGRQAVLTAGGRTRLSEQLGLYAEQKQSSGEGSHSLVRGFGVDVAPADNWTTGLRFERGRLSDRRSGDLNRDALSLNLGFKDERLKVLSAVELRRDRSVSLGTIAGVCDITALPTADPCVSGGGATERNSVLFKTSAQYQLDPAWRLLGVLNLARSSSSQGAFYDGDYTEAVAAAAYRPVDNDRWNTLFKYTYFYNLPSSGQVDNFTNRLLDFTQRSHVLNVDTIYDLTPWLSVGAKYGLRVGELRASRTGGEWSDSRAQLLVGRADIHFLKERDATFELRRLSVTEADDDRSGLLVAIYRHLGANGKVGVGYNFTDFSDDLTDLSYRSRGLFLNVLAQF